MLKKLYPKNKVLNFLVCTSRAIVGFWRISFSMDGKESNKFMNFINSPSKLNRQNLHRYPGVHPQARALETEVQLRLQLIGIAL